MLRALTIACVLACAGAAQAQDTLPPVTRVDETCGVLAVQDENRTSYIPVPGYSVMNAPSPLTRPPEQERVDAIICDRLSLVISPQDYRVLTDLRVPFYIRAGIRLIVLEVAEGQLRVRFLRGEPTDEERAQLAVALDQSQENARLALQGQPQ